MQTVLEVNKEELWCRVQPGLVQDELNAQVRPVGLQFGPDTSTSNRATIGGMWASAYNVLAVGVTSGDHSRGTTTSDMPK